MRVAVWIVIVGSVGGIFLSGRSMGQSGRTLASPYFNLSQHYLFLDYAVNSGLIKLEHPLNQPYQTAELRKAFAAVDGARCLPFWSHWRKLLTRDLLRFERPDSLEEGTGKWQVGANGVYRLGAESDRQWSKYRAELFAVYSLPYLVLTNRTATDQLFKDDPYYFGDTGEWIQGRVEDAYFMLQYKRLRLFAGRIGRNLGVLNEPSLILSDQPYSYDHFGLEVNTRRLKYSFYTTRLDDKLAYDSQSTDQRLRQTKRFVSVQRGEIMLRDNLHVGLAQAAIYGGENQTFEAVFLNPMNLYYVAQRNQRIQMDGFWAVEFFWKPFPRVTWFSQWLIDDVIVNNEPGQDDRAVHPDRMGITSKLAFTDVVLPGTHVSAVYTRIGNWTYTSYRTWENYVFQQKSLGYPKNSVETVKIGLDYFGRPPFIINVQAIYERHGEQDVNRVFGDRREKFPMGTVEASRTVEMSCRYMPSNFYFASLSYRYRSRSNAENIAGRSVSDHLLLLTLHATVEWGFLY